MGDKSIDEIIQFMSKRLDIEYSKEQLGVLREKSNTLHIMACAGSGKTTLATHLIGKKILSGEIARAEDIMCTTFSISGAKELQIRANDVLELLGISGKIRSKTLHALFLGALKEFGVLSGSDFNIISDSQKANIIRVKSEEILGRRLRENEGTLIGETISVQVNNMMTDEKLFVSHLYNLDMSIHKYAEIRSAYANEKAIKGLLEFDDLNLYMYSMPKDIIRCFNFKSLVIDESQDLSRIQYEIIKKLGLLEKSIIIGDDDQSIYEWRGADPSIIIEERGTGKFKNYVLPVNYRCPSIIVDTAKVGIENNNNRVEKSIRASEDGGEVSVLGYTNYMEMSEEVVKEVAKIRLLDEEESIAILCRNNRHSSIISNWLTHEGIYCRSKTPLSQSREFKDIKKIYAMVEEGVMPSSMLWKIIERFSSAKSKVIEEVQMQSGASPVEIVHWVVHHVYGVGNDKNRDSKLCIPEYKEEMVREKLFDKSAKENIQAFVELYNNLILKNKETGFNNILEMYIENSGFSRSEDGTLHLRGIVEYLNKYIGYSNISEWITWSEQVEYSEMDSNNNIDAITVHQAKGREWDNVFVCTLSNAVFPSFKEIEKLIKKNSSHVAIDKLIEEGRRLFYVASTRAKKKMWYVVDKDNPSLYCMEALLGSSYLKEYINGGGGNMPGDIIKLVDKYKL